MATAERPSPRGGDLEAGLLEGGGSSDFFGATVAELDAQTQRGFIRKVYGILGAQLLVTTLISAPFLFVSKAWAEDHQVLGLICSLSALAVIIAGSCSPGIFRSYPSNYIFCAVFTVLEALTVGFIVSLYT